MPDLAAFASQLGDIPHSLAPDVLAEKSRDYFWFSPILREELEGLTADIVVMPRTQDEAIRVAGLAARHRIPLTARGAGTGNFGQAVPLAGGIVVDMTRVDRIVATRRSTVRAEAGVNLATLDDHLRATGRELRMHPSTKRVATLGGFVAGGHAGVGSINYGILRDRGNILGIKLATLEATPRLIEVRGNDVATVHHAYGVNGLILEVELPTAPAWSWHDVIVAFEDFTDAARFGLALATADGIVKKMVSPVDARIARYFTGLAERCSEGTSVVLAMVADECREPFDALVAEHRGRVTLWIAEGGFADTPIYEYAWGHTTLRVLRDRPEVTHVIAIFSGADPLDQIDRIGRRFGDEIAMHLEFKRLNGAMVVEGIPVFTYRGRAHLDALCRAFESEGVKIANCHSYYLQNGGMIRIDEAQIAFKRAVDPAGLMNPGKIAGFDEIAGAPGGATDIPASGFAY